MRWRFSVPVIALLVCLTAVEAADMEMGYDDLIQDGSVSLSAGTKHFVRFPQYFPVPYQVWGVTAWFSQQNTCRIRLYPDSAGLPDTSSCLYDTTVSLNASRWRPYPFEFQVTDTGDLWVCITGTGGQLYTDRSYPDGNSWQYSGGVMERLDSDDLLVRLRVRGEAVTHDVCVQSIDNPFWYVAPAEHDMMPRATVKNLGTGSETFDVSCLIDSSGVVVYTSTRSVNLGPNSSAYVSFDPWTVGDSGAVYQMKVFTQLDADTCRFNDTLAKNLTSNPEEELFYDLRTLHATFVFLGSITPDLLERITPAAYPAQVMKLKMSFHPVGSPDSFQLRLVVRPDLNPQDFYSYEPDMARVIWTGYRPTTNRYGWREYDLSDEQIVIAGEDAEAYVGYTYVRHPGGSFNVHCDDTYRYPNGDPPYGFAERFGFDSEVEVDRDYLVRARVRYIPSSAIAERKTTGVRESHGFYLVPNPVSDLGRICFNLTGKADVEIGLYDASGRCLKSLHKGRLGPGRHFRDVSFSELGSGIYFLKMKTGDAVLVERAVVVK